MKKFSILLLTLVLASLACTKAIITKDADFHSGSDNEEHRHDKLDAGVEPYQKDVPNIRYTMLSSDENSASVTKFEKIPADEERLIKDMILILQNKMSRDYPEGNIRRDAHPKNLACLQAEFIVEQNIPGTLKRGIFASSHTYPAWIRISSSSGKIQSDKVKDVRGFAIKIMGVEGEQFERQNEEKETQDFILMSYPVMPLGTVKLFHDAVYYSIKWSPIVFLSRLVLTGNFNTLNELRKARQNQTSPLDIRYWSTTPYLCGAEQSVKYSLIPTSHLKSSLPTPLTDDYLTENMEKHLAAQEASFDFMIQVQEDPVQMPVEDAAVEWSENESPFIKVATLRIPPQSFRTREREELAEDLSFSPAHSLIDHQPIGGINRARVKIYGHLSEFRHKNNNKPLVKPSYQLTKGID